MKRSALVTVSYLSLIFATISSLSVAYAGEKTTTHRKGADPLLKNNNKIMSVKPKKRKIGDQASLQDENVTVQSHRFRSKGTSQVVSRATMNLLASGSNPLQALSLETPGVNFSSSDPLGQDVSGGSVLYVRGFDQTQVGMTVDGIPMGDQTWQQYNGIMISQAVIQENISQISASQGAGNESVAANTNLGGTVTFSTMAVKDHKEEQISQMFGSNANFRTFVKLDSGILNHSGTKFYVAFARTDGDKWKGSGDQFEQQINIKMQQPLGSRGHVDAFFSWSDFEQYNYMTAGKNIIDKLGYNVDYLYPDYATSYMAASGQYPAYANSLGNASDAALVTSYRSKEQAINYVLGVNGSYDLTDNLKENLSIYMQRSNLGTPVTQAFETLSGSPLSEANSLQEGSRIGLIEGLTYQVAKHTLRAGLWYENNTYNVDMNMYADPVLGQGVPSSAYMGSGQPYAQEYRQNWSTNTLQAYFSEDWQPIKSLTLHAGFKSLLETTRGGATYTNEALTGQTALPNGSLTAFNAFLPHFSVDYHFLSHEEIYADIAENMRAYAYSGWVTSYGAWSAQNQTQFDLDKKSIRPQTTWNYVLGYRHNSHYFDLNADFYYTKYHNRLVNMTEGNVYQPVTAFINAGSETMYGFDGGVTIRPLSGLSIFNGFSYNKSTYDDSINSGGVYYDLKGKKQVGYPSYMYKATLTYRRGNFEGMFNASYLGSRPLSYMNDVKVSPYWTENVTLSYNFGQIGFAKNLKASFSVYNLANEKYVSAMGLFGYPLSGDLQTLFVAPPRQFFGTISAKF